MHRLFYDCIAIWYLRRCQPADTFQRTDNSKNISRVPLSSLQLTFIYIQGRNAQSVDVCSLPFTATHLYMRNKMPYFQVAVKYLTPTKM